MLIESDKVTAGGPVVEIGSRVTVRDATHGEDWYVIVEPEDSDPARRAISKYCPMAVALLGHRAGAGVRVRTPLGVRLLTLVTVETASEA